MLSRTFPRALPRLNRTLASSPRAYSTHPAHSGAQGSGNQSMGEDTADIQRKNAAVPVFIGLGVVTVGYIVYSQMSAKKDHAEANKERKTDMRQEKHVAGDKDRVSSRG